MIKTIIGIQQTWLGSITTASRLARRPASLNSTENHEYNTSMLEALALAVMRDLGGNECDCDAGSNVCGRDAGGNACDCDADKWVTRRNILSSGAASAFTQYPESADIPRPQPSKCKISRVIDYSYTQLGDRRHSSLQGRTQSSSPPIRQLDIYQPIRFTKF